MCQLVEFVAQYKNYAGKTAKRIIATYPEEIKSGAIAYDRMIMEKASFGVSSENPPN